MQNRDPQTLSNIPTNTAVAQKAFAHLHVQSSYSLGKGASKVKALIARARDLNIPAIALVDEGNMYGAFEFSKVAAENGIQPIVGTKLKMEHRETGICGSIILLSQNAKGYENICTILTASHRPREGVAGGSAIIDHAVFWQHLDGVIALTGARDGYLNALLNSKHAKLAQSEFDLMREHFCDRVFVEISRSGNFTAEAEHSEKELIKLATQKRAIKCIDGVTREQVPLIAASETIYAEEKHHDAFEILLALGKGQRVRVNAQGAVEATMTERFHMRSYDEMAQLFSDMPQALTNTALVAKRCAFMVHKRNPILPPFETEAGLSEDEELARQARVGLSNRFETMKTPLAEREAYKARLEYELKTIISMGFPGYFLIVSDFIKWAKANDIPVGPGRGSGAGSLVAFALQITNLDPLPHGLLFERFLNPDRVSMPDFDIDFCKDRREEVIKYVVDRYGTDYVSLIATFDELKTKSALADFARAARSDDFSDYRLGEVERLKKSVPMEGVVPKKLKDAYNDPDNHAFKEMVDSEVKFKVLYDNALKIEDLYKTQSSHAAGVVIGGQPLQTLIPVGWDSTKLMGVSQFNMKWVEQAGLVKFDFLGLKTLSVLRETLRIIETTTGEVINLDALPLDDAATYALIANGDTNAVFQFESAGMKKWLKALRPDKFSDLVAMTSLFRPGPMDMIPTYVDCKNGLKEPHYPEPVEETKLFLEETHGIMVYQEQVMQVAQKVAGYTLGQADLLRRAMGKKIKEEMDKERQRFVDGAVSLGRDRNAANSLFDHIAKFASYGFNKSHAAAYSLVSYHTAYLKAHYPAQFCAAVMTYHCDDAKKGEKMAKIKEDMDKFDIPLLPPDINKSYPRFTCEEYQPGRFGVRLGLLAINGISSDLETFLAERAKGDFTSIEDAYERTCMIFNKGQFENLAATGAFDLMSKNRASASSVLAYLGRGGRKKSTSTEGLFGDTLRFAVPAETKDKAEWGNKADREFSSVGFYFNDHPMTAYEPKLRRLKVKRKESLIAYMQENQIESLNNKRLSGLIDSVKVGRNKHGMPYVIGYFIEKSDRFDVYFGQGEGKDIEQIKNTLLQIKDARRPAIIHADIALESDGEISIWGKAVDDCENLMAAERGRVRISIDADLIIADSVETKELSNIEAQQQSGTLTDQEAQSLIMPIKARQLSRKVRLLNQILEQYRDDNSDAATKVIISISLNSMQKNVELNGKFTISKAAENALKAIDGIRQINEEL